MAIKQMAAAAALVLLLAGCGSATEDSGTAAAPGKTPKKARPEAEMVSAVSNAKGQAPVDLKFELQGKPVVGEELEIRLALIPSTKLETVIARFQGTEAVELKAGHETAPLERPEMGIAVEHTLTVVPRQEGVSYITATVVADSLTQSTARQFSIPVIASAGSGTAVAESAAKP